MNWKRIRYYAYIAAGLAWLYLATITAFFKYRPSSGLIAITLAFLGVLMVLAGVGNLKFEKVRAEHEAKMREIQAVLMEAAQTEMTQVQAPESDDSKG